MCLVGNRGWDEKVSLIRLLPSGSLLFYAVVAPYSQVTGHAVPLSAEGWALGTMWTPTVENHCSNSASSLS